MLLTVGYEFVHALEKRRRLYHFIFVQTRYVYNTNRTSKYCQLVQILQRKGHVEFVQQLAQIDKLFLGCRKIKRQSGTSDC